MPDIRVFISHSWHHSGHYDTLGSWLFERTRVVQNTGPITGYTSLRFLDNSVPRDNPIHTGGSDHQLELAILDKISGSDVIVIPTGMYANYSRWIKREINIAIGCQKPKLAVNPWGQERPSRIVRENADEEAGWNQESVVNKIWQLYGRPPWELTNNLLS